MDKFEEKLNELEAMSKEDKSKLIDTMKKD